MDSTEFDIDDSPEAVFQFMLEQGWSDGLPVIPPTESRVRSMLDYAQRDASELVGFINPDAGSATVEKIAINAVMAGCLPEYMPVLIAAVQAITEPAFNIHGLQMRSATFWLDQRCWANLSANRKYSLEQHNGSRITPR